MTSLPNDHRGPVASSLGTLLFIAFGVVLWAAQFSVAYAINTFACVVGQSPSLSVAVVAAATIVALGTIAVYVLCTERAAVLFGLPLETARRDGLIKTGRLVALLATLAILWTGISIAFVSACMQGR